MSKILTVKDIINVTKGKLIYGDENEICENFSKNTKGIKENDIFIGIKGERFDGSTLYKDALLNGAKGCIINKNANEKIEIINNKFIVEVPDTLEAIQKVASYKRSQYDIPVVAITGSVGKTSTKDIIASVLSEQYKVQKTQGNMNNHIGLPMTILGLKDHTALVVEMGMNHFGEIRVLTNIAKPNVAVLTNIGTAHIGILGSRENILKSKMEILEGLQKDGKVVINNDNDLLHKWYLDNKEKYNIFTYGINEQSKEMAEDIKYYTNNSTYTLVDDKNENKNVMVPVGGEAFIYNSLAATAVGRALNISTDKIEEGIEKFQLSKMRLDILKSNKGFMIINDCYNANFDSMKSSLNYLSKVDSKRKIAVLGDMLELGEYSTQLHTKVGNEVVNNKIDILVTVGTEAKNIAKVAKDNNIKVYELNNNKEAVEILNKILTQGDAILVKASNSMHFTEITNSIL